MGIRTGFPKVGDNFSLLYSQQNTVTDSALNLKHIENLSTLDDLDTKPTVKELGKAITEMVSWKAPGSDGIPVDLFRQCCLLPLLHEILVKCWREGKVLQDMRDTKIITLYKNKGAISDCNNHMENFPAWYCWKSFCMCNHSSPTEISSKSIFQVAM